MTEIERFLHTYGRGVALYERRDEPSASWRAFIQPLRYKNKMYLEGTHTPIGTNRQGYYLYLGPAAHRLRGLPQAAFLRAGEMDYQVDRAELVYLGDEPLYVWAVLRERTREEDFDA